MVSIGGIMKFTLLLCLLLISYRSFSYEKAPKENKNFLDFKNLTNNKAPNPPTLNIYDNKKFTGKPIISFDKEGLSIKGKLVCKWYPGYEEGMQNRFLSEVKDGSPCTHPPIFINYIENHPYMLWIELDDLENSDYFQTSFEGKPVFIEKKKNLDFAFELSKIRQAELNRPIEQAEYEKVVRDNVELKEYIAKLHTCFKNEDIGCITTTEFKIAEAYLWYLEKICENDSPQTKKARMKLGKYCGDLGEPEELKKPYNKEKLEKDKIARMTFQKEFWNNMRSCFHNDDPFKLTGYTYTPVSANPINISFYPKDENYVSCTINGLGKTGEKLKWKLNMRRRPESEKEN